MSETEGKTHSSQQPPRTAHPAPLSPKQSEFVELLGQLVAELWQKEMTGIESLKNRIAVQSAAGDVASDASNAEKIVRNSLSLRAAPNRRHAAARKTPTTRKARERK
jgi:hypothetical protein